MSTLWASMFDIRLIQNSLLMLVETEAIVLRSLKYGDNKMIVDMFTRSDGRMSFVAGVARSGKSRVRKQLFQPMTILSVVCDVRPRMRLQRLKDASLQCPYSSLPFEPYKLSMSLFVAEFLCYVLRGEQRNLPLFDYVADSMRWLDGCPGGCSNFHLVFLMRLSRFLGFWPNLDGYEPGDCFDMRGSCFCRRPPVHRDFLMPHEARLIGLMMRMNFSTMRLYRMSRAERNRMLEVLTDYYRIHIPDFPELKSLAVLREMFD